FKKFEEEAEKKERGRAEGKPLFDVIIDVSVRFFKGRQEARIEIRNLIAEILKDMNQSEKAEQGIYSTKSMFSQQYVFARLDESVIKQLVMRSEERRRGKGW